MEYNVENIPFMFTTDDKVFHYTKRDTLINKILKQNKFKLSNYRGANDPYEYNMKIWGLHGFVPPTQSHRKKIQNFLINNIAYIAYCKNTQIKSGLGYVGCSKPRMWAQYGENHKGVCLVFSKSGVLKTISEKFIDGDINIWDCDIKYTRELFRIYKNFSLDIGFGGNITKKLIEFLSKNKKDMFFTKHRDFQDEDEYRVVLMKNDRKFTKQNLLINISSCIDGIVVGDRFPEEDKQILDRLCKGNDLCYGQLKWRNAGWFYQDWTDS